LLASIATNYGDDDMRSLFIAASTSLYRMKTKVPGRPQLC
jgi:hypothetical protein